MVQRRRPDDWTQLHLLILDFDEIEKVRLVTGGPFSFFAKISQPANKTGVRSQRWVVIVGVWSPGLYMNCGCCFWPSLRWYCWVRSPRPRRKNRWYLQNPSSPA